MKYLKHSNSTVFRSDGKISPSILTLLVGLGFSLLLVVTVSQFSSVEPQDLNLNLKLNLEADKYNNDIKNLHQQSNEKYSNKLKLDRNSLNKVNLIARTKQGSVRGTQKESRNGRNYFAFYNIPYAKPPINDLRFKPPQPLENKFSSEIRDGTRPGPQCIQREKYAPVLRSAGQEDCLVLNIFTPKIPPLMTDTQSDPIGVSPPPPPPETFPVLFYVHGGGFDTGNGSRYGADYFEDEAVIVVTVEFRLGVFGLLSTEDEEVPGNMAFKDIVMALKWVQENIAFFSGDPEKVTVFGNSSGSMMVHALLLSHMCIGLFSAAICQSGVSITQGSIFPSPKSVAVNLGIEVGCPQPATTKELVECLRKIPAEDLAIVQSPFVMFAPTLEYIPTNGDLSDVFLTDYPYKLMQKADYPMKVPLILGDNSVEELSTTLTTLKDVELVKQYNENFEETLPKEVVFRHPPNSQKLKEIKKFYFGSRTIGNSSRRELGHLLSDIKWNHGTKMAALAHANHSPTYLYWLSKEPSKSYANLTGFSPPFGVSHADELQYLFLYDGYPEIPIGTPYTRFSQKLVQNWVSFAKFGKPALVEWEPIKLEDNGTVWFNLDDQVRPTRRLRRRIKFWDDFKYELYE